MGGELSEGDVYFNITAGCRGIHAGGYPPEYVESGFLSGFQQLAVSQLVPPGILRFCDRVAFEEQDEGRGRAVVKENEHRPFVRSSE